MTDLRMWSDLSPSERAEAVTKAREIVAGGEERCRSRAKLNKAALKAMRGKATLEAMHGCRQRGALMGMLAAASLNGGGSITLPKIKFMEEGT